MSSPAILGGGGASDLCGTESLNANRAGVTDTSSDLLGNCCRGVFREYHDSSVALVVIGTCTVALEPRERRLDLQWNEAHFSRFDQEVDAAAVQFRTRTTDSDEPARLAN